MNEINEIIAGNTSRLRQGSDRSHFFQLAIEAVAAFIYGCVSTKNTRNKASTIKGITRFLDASSHLYNRGCPSVRRSAGHAFVKNWKINDFDRI